MCRLRLSARLSYSTSPRHGAIAATAARRMRLAAGALARRAAGLAARAAVVLAAARGHAAPRRTYATLTTEQARASRRYPAAARPACFYVRRDAGKATLVLR